MSETLKKQDVVAPKNSSNQPKGKWYSDDELDNLIIEEYKKFKESLNKQVRAAFEHNLNIAQKGCEDLYYSLKGEFKIDCKKVHLRYTSIEGFDAIVEIPYKDYMSENFNKAFNRSVEISNTLNNSKFFIEFHFMPSSRKIDQQLLNSDGYFMSFKPIHVKKTTARKT